MKKITLALALFVVGIFVSPAQKTVDNMFAVVTSKDAPVPGDILEKYQFKNLHMSALMCKNITTAHDERGIGGFNATYTLYNPEDLFQMGAGLDCIMLSPTGVGRVVWEYLNPTQDEQIVLALLIEGRYKMFVLDPSLWKEGEDKDEEEALYEPRIRVFPNPARDSVTIESTLLSAGETLVFLDMQGREVMSTPWDGRPISVKSLPPGQYLIKTSGGICILFVEK